MISKNTAITMLVQMFDSNNLTFRDITLMRQVFDEAVESCNEARSELEADYGMGRGAHPVLPSKDTEDDFYSVMEAQASQRLSERGIKASDRALEAIVDFAVDKAEYEPRDFYYFR